MLREKRDTHGKSVTEEALDLKISCSLFQQYKLFHIPVVGSFSAIIGCV